jgi:precorrin-6B methylase 2
MLKKWLFRPLKNLLFGSHAKPFTVLSGPLRGTRYYTDPAHKSQRILGLEELEVSPIVRRFVLESATFIDVGASDGEYPVFAKRLKPTLHVVGCDAIPENEALFHQNLALNNLSSEGTRWMAGFIGQAHIPLDSIAESLPSPVTLKIDVDGGEVDVLLSGIQVLSRPDTRLVLEVHSRELEQRSIELLKGLGFQCKIVDQAWWRKFIPELRPGWNRWVIATKQ